MNLQTSRAPRATAWTLAATLGGLGGIALADESRPEIAETQTGESDESAARRKRAAAAAAPRRPVESRGYGTRAETEPPRYVRHGNDTGIAALADADWLTLGADYRARYELRHHDYRRDAQSDDPLLLRTRLWLGVERALDPLRLGVELQDSRLSHSEVADSTRDVNHADVLQAYAELYQADAWGAGEPMRLQVGRLAFEYLDRRLISRNPWRNTTNNFEGLRLINGSHQGSAWIDLLALKPVEIRPDQPDKADHDRYFYGAIGSYGGAARLATLQPYALRLIEEENDRRYDTLGLRAYAVFASGFDYDVDVALQSGHVGEQDHRARAASFELGYTFKLPWTPRLSGFVGYASGDDDPADDESNRFNRLFGFGRPWSANDYQVWENLITPKLRLESRPGENLQIEAGYGAFWLASDTDSWSQAGRRDRTGESGDFIGVEADARLRWRADPRVEVVSGYAHFFPGGFTRNTGRSPDADFFYLELNFQAFK